MPTPPPQAWYEERSTRASAARQRLLRRADSVSHLRLIAFLTLLGALVWAEATAGAPHPAPLVLAVAALTAFVALVLHHAALRRRVARHTAEHELATEGLARIRRDWDALAPWGGPAAPPDHPYAADLDVLGPASLYRLLGPTATPAGAAAVASRLLTPADAGEAAARQQAVRELAPKTELRFELAVHGRLAGAPFGEERVAAFLEWCIAEPTLRRRPLLLWSARLLPLATAGLLALDLLGGGHLWLFSVGAALLLLAAQGRVLAEVRRGAAPAGALDAHVRVFELIERAELRAERLTRAQQRLRGAAHAMRRLARLLHLADLRLSIVHFAVNLLTLWDVHVAWLLDRWRARHGAHVRDWIESAGDADALAAFATLAFEAPHWRYARVEAGLDRLEAEALAHPLLPAAVGVANDVVVGPAGTVLFVTGSNMSGKSTLLRAVGANAVLALCGAPVCATSLRLPPLRVFTSMRLRDSLERGLSLFMAEVERLSRLVAAAESRDEAGPVLYLLDEILQGTNAEEHRVGACWVLRRLLATAAIGAVATHDLGLAGEPALRTAARPVHLRETVVEEDEGRPPRTQFDYRLRDGLATSRNALRIMRLAGLEPPDEGA